MGTALAPVRDDIVDAEFEIIDEATDNESQLERQVRTIGEASTDAVADTRTLRVVALPPSESRIEGNIVVEAPGGLKLAVAPIAHDQFAERLGIPKPYYQRMLGGQPGLLAVNMNLWLQQEHDRRLLRMIAPYNEDLTSLFQQIVEQGGSDYAPTYTIRAFLGASYRPLDNAELVNVLLPVMRERGAALSEFSLTEHRLHAKFLTVQRDVASIVEQYAEKYGVTVDQAKRHYTDPKTGKDISWVEEVVQQGVYVRNSETGFAALDVRGVFKVLKCLNDYIAEQSARVIHVGGKRGKNGEAENELSFLSAQTQRLENAAIFSRVRDTAVALLDEQAQLNRALAITAAKNEVLALPLPTFEFVGNVARTLDLTEAESAVLQEEVVKSQMVEGGLTRFTVSQGVTALARQTDNYDRRTELERAGWTILDGSTKLLEAGKAAARRRN